MYLYVDCLEREINTPQILTLSEAKKQLFYDFLDAKGIDDESLTNLIEDEKFDEAMDWLAEKEYTDDENYIVFEDENNMTAYCETRNHDNWDAKVFKLETTEFSVSIKP